MLSLQDQIYFIQCKVIIHYREKTKPFKFSPMDPTGNMCKTQQDWNKDGHNIQDTCVVNISSKVLKKMTNQSTNL